MQYGEITIRMATDADVGSIERLAQLDSKRTPGGPQLVAERGSRMIAAFAIADGEVTADPFTHTEATVELLRFRAAQLRRVSRDSSGRIFGRRIARTVSA